MLAPKTYFEQVPLELVKKIVAGQTEKEQHAEPDAEKKRSKTLIDKHEPS
jgi:hypothetical protein